MQLLDGATGFRRPPARGVAPFELPGRTFRLFDCERGTKRIKVNRRTRYERIDGLRGLRAGMRNVEVIAKRRNGRWVATEVERSGGGGEHGGCDDD